MSLLAKKSFILFLLCLFSDLMMKLTEETGPDGTVAQIGQIVIDWVCTVAYKHIIRAYIYMLALQI